MHTTPILKGVIIIAIIAAALYFVTLRNAHDGEGITGRLESLDRDKGEQGLTLQENALDTEEDTTLFPEGGARPIRTTDGVQHSIPLNEILSGGPPKDGIPSIDNPIFEDALTARQWLTDDSVGLGLVVGELARFYPYSVLVWHEIVNDEIFGRPVLVTYCPLCATAIVFERNIRGETVEFGVSGRLWQSNLLMYNRAPDPANESLWSQVLGEAVVGPHTGDRLAIIPANTVKFGDWIQKHPDTEILSRDTGVIRDYGRDPYGNYYTDESVSFGATFTDTRLHPKTFVIGVEVDGVYIAYPRDSLPVGHTTDMVAGVSLTLTKSAIDEVSVTRSGGDDVSVVAGFWFSWLAVHPDTLLWSAP